MTILVGYASAHGSTAGIAHRIGDRLTTNGHTATVVDCSRSRPDDGPATALILGSAVHDGQWMPSASRRAADGSSVPVWAFSVGMVGDEDSMLARPVAAVLRRMQRVREPDAVRALRGHGRLRDHHRFTGRFTADDADDAGKTGRRVFRLLGGRYGDHRNWAAVDAWADTIAADLTGPVRR